MTTEQETAALPADLDDLNLLDDRTSHCWCSFCQPGVKAFEVVVAICGSRIINRSDGGRRRPPKEACPMCLELWTRPCGRCGQ